jgi:hypothetical protein
MQGEVPAAGSGNYPPRMRDIETIDSELGLVAALRRAAREWGGPLPSIHVADALVYERRELTDADRATPFSPPAVCGR